MYDLYLEIRQAINDIFDAEWDNMENELHHLRGRSDKKARGIRSECYGRREDRRYALQGLLNAALLPGIEAGFSGEAVLALLRKLSDGVEAAAYWDTTFEGHADDDRAAWCHLMDLSGLGGAPPELIDFLLQCLDSDAEQDHEGKREDPPIRPGPLLLPSPSSNGPSRERANTPCANLRIGSPPPNTVSRAAGAGCPVGPRVPLGLAAPSIGSCAP
jgi:hypothetical protein